jgi:VanZ family protein
MHATEFFILFLISLAAFTLAKRKFLKDNPLRSAFIYGLAMAVITEFAQFYVPGRSSDFYDFLVDLFGLFIAALLFFPRRFLKRDLS